MMTNELPKDYDVIVLGTGMVECIFAAAAARIGKSVLHLDKNGFYGGDWASFNLDHLQRFVRGEDKESYDAAEVSCGEIKDGETTLKCSNFKTISNVSENIHVKLEASKCEGKSPPVAVELLEAQEGSSKDEETADSSHKTESKENTESNYEVMQNTECEDEKRKFQDKSAVESKPSNSAIFDNDSDDEWSWDRIMKEFRRFNIDISPKLLFSRGDLVELLISSNVARYAEYKCLTRILTYTDKLEQVPCSRADVFSTKHISIIDKRMLMQLLNYCLEVNLQAEENHEFETQLFADFLRRRKLSESVRHYVIHAIAMVKPDATVEEGLIATQKFLKSLGRFGNTPFLWPMYGSGELPQCFCRLCAVFGGIYFLRRSVDSIILDSDRNCTGIVSEGDRFNCRLLVLDSTYAPKEYLPQNVHQHKISRAVLITAQSLVASSKDQISLLRIPPCTTHNAINFLELPPGSMVCPEGLNVIHATTEAFKETAKDDLQKPVEFLFSSSQEAQSVEKPQLLYDLYFNLIDTTKCDLNRNTPENLLMTSNSGGTLDFDESVIEARKLFHGAFPECEFLPRAPDPDEIILDSNDNDQAEEAGGFGNAAEPQGQGSDHGSENNEPTPDSEVPPQEGDESQLIKDVEEEKESGAIFNDQGQSENLESE